MPSKLAIVTDPENGEFDEDKNLAEILSPHFNTRIVPFDKFKSIADKSEVALIRNIWPHHNSADISEYRKKSREMRLYFANNNIPAINDLSGSGDVKGKDYLIELFEKGYPVIPSIDKPGNFNKLPESNKYVSKPKDGLSAIGLKILEKEKILEQNLENQIIQPLIDFVEESCFLFIDGKFQYAVKTPDRKLHIQIQQFSPSKEEVELARKFVEWNALKEGIQRIDFCKTKEGKILLMEIEDDSPLTFLSVVDNTTKNQFVKNLVSSIKSKIPNHSNST